MTTKKKLTFFTDSKLLSGLITTSLEQVTGPSPVRPATVTINPARRRTSAEITNSISSAPLARITQAVLDMMQDFVEIKLDFPEITPKDVFTKDLKVKANIFCFFST